MHTHEATVIQTRHRIPEQMLTEEQILVFQVPYPEVLTTVEPDTHRQKEMHANLDYSKLWVLLYEDTARFGDSRISNRYPVVINGHYAMDPSPIPRFDIPKLSGNPALLLFGAGREKRVYAIPPYTQVRPLVFDDRPFRVEDFGDNCCERCGSTGVFFDMVKGSDRNRYYCSDTDSCDRMLRKSAREE
jgi:alpha-D-ribose 1-methylphosphonate 5-phosphate C-P lyase